MEYPVGGFAITDAYYRTHLVEKLEAFPAEVLEDAFARNQVSEIHKIVWGISNDDLDRKVRACPEAVDGPDHNGLTPLDYAIKFGNSDHIRVLLSHGADIGRRPHYLFCTAVKSGNCASIQFLLDGGLRPNDLLFDTQEEDVSVFSFGCLPFWNKYCVDCKPEVDRLLIDHGFNFNIRGYDGVTALMACCNNDSSHHRTKRMKSLLERGVDPEITDKYGQTAIHHALRNDNLRAFELLTVYGARLDARTSKGETVLHMAVERTRGVAMVHALSKAGIMQLDLDARRNDGKIAFNVLRRRAAETESNYWKFPIRTTEDESHIEVHVQIIRAFESLFQQIQKHQGVPLEDRYPALPIAALGDEIAAELVEDTYPASSGHAIHAASDEDDIPGNPDPTEPICTPPGAWPK